MSESGLAALLERMLRRLRGGEASLAMRESLEQAIEESDRHSPALSAREHVMLANLLKFGEIKVKNVMVPRAHIVAADENMSLPALVALFREAQHSRIPIYRETLDDPTGVVHIKDLLALLAPTSARAYGLGEGSIAAIKRPVLFAPPAMRALDLLVKMQATHTHLALVIDEYGGTDGLVSIEDLIEQIVGDIADEHDEEAPHVRREDDSFIADARLDLDDFRRETGLDLAPASQGEEIDTVGGLVISLLGRVPQRGEIVAHPDGSEFEVLEADPRRIKRVRVRPPRVTESSRKPAP